ncbi:MULTISPECIES: hypothetical protein [Nocardia]|uniref:Uncharacterized protein n=1 Tax=Nocardia africana TaxID=134964 RepID=A0A378X6G7_9NOCA|nr:hypothetical protein [Nocardia africana]MCC3317957.1 hypothetical protein [Nocardia africana]SUA48732.1 Uncharacterised protein [Nocardia africana]
MTDTGVAETTTPAVPDLDTEKQILVARIHKWAHRRGYEDRAEIVLNDIGLGSMLPGGPQPYTLDLSALRDAIPTELDLQLRDHQRGPGSLAVRVESFISDQLTSFNNKLYRSELTAKEVAEQSASVDVTAVLDEWGATTSPYPPAGTEEIEQFRHRTIKAVLKVGNDRGYCGVLEDAIQEIGLMDYLPAREKDMDIEIPADLGRISVTLELDRLGQMTRSEFIRTVALEISNRIADKADLLPPDLISDPVENSGL